MKLLSKKKIAFNLLFLIFPLCICAQNVKVELTFTYFNTATKTFTVNDLKVIDLPTGATAFWYDTITGGTALAPTTPLVSGQVYYLETIPAANIGTRLQTIVYEISPLIEADKPNDLCVGDQVTMMAKGMLTKEQFEIDNTNGNGLNLTKIIDYGNSSYYVREEKMSWEAANNLINTIPGAAMYIINDTAEENTVYNELVNLGIAVANDPNAFWLGLKQYANATDFDDTINQTGWYWIDGTALNYSNWSASEPNDYRDAPGMTPPFKLYENGGINDEDYAQFDFQNRGIKWNDAPNDTPNRNSFPIFEFTGTTGLQWYKLNTSTNAYEIILGETSGDLQVTALEPSQKYRLEFLMNGQTVGLEYEVTAVNTQIYPIPTNLTTACDDETDPLAQDGIVDFDTTNFENLLLNGQTGVNVIYTDASGALLPSPLPNPFTTGTQSVSVRVESVTNASCIATGTIDFVVNPLPRIRTNADGSEDVTVCAASASTTAVLDAGIDDGSPATNYTYVWSKDGSPISPAETNETLTVSTSGNYEVEVTSIATGCASERSINFELITAPVVNPIAMNLTTACDDETDPLLQDGSVTFDTSTFESTLLGGQTGMAISYTDASGAVLPSPFPASFTTGTQTINVRIESVSKPSCYSTGTIDFVVNPLPRIRTNSNGSEDVNICSTSGTTTTVLDAGIDDGSPATNYTYIWSKDGSPISPAETNETLTVSTSGNYEVEVTSIATGCASERSINFEIITAPVVNPIPTNLTTSCDDETDPLTQDGSVTFDSSTFESTLLGGQTGMAISYTDASGAALPSPFPASFTTGTQTIDVRIESISNPSCYSTGTIDFVVNPLPRIRTNNNGSEDVSICSTLGTTSTVLDAGIDDGSPATNYTYIWSKDGSPISPAQTNETLTVSTSGNYEVEVTSIATGCASERSINFEIITAPVVNPIPTNLTTACDDETDPLTQDGSVTFDSSTFESALLGGQTGMAISYTDASGAALPSPFPSTFTTGTQTINVLIESVTTPSCYSTGTIDFVVNPLPRIRTNSDGSEDVSICSTSGTTTTVLDAGIADGSPATDYTYVWSKDGSPISPAQTNETLTVSTSGNYEVEVTSIATGCASERSINFEIITAPVVNPIPTNLTTSCDDETDPLTQDGSVTFDSSTFESTLLGGQTGMTISYTDASGAVLPSPFPSTFTTGTQTINVLIESVTTPSCYSTGTIDFVVNPLPRIRTNSNGSEDVSICSTSGTTTTVLDAGIDDGSPASDYTYVWSKDGSPISPAQTNETLTVSTDGLYSVEVSSVATNCTSFREIKVLYSSEPKIKSIDTVDLSDENSITINMEDSFGTYEYSVTGASGPFQSSNYFDNLAPGVYDVYVNDLNGCGSDSDTVYLLGIPKFFTPNNDGFNDYWTVKGLDANSSMNTMITIYDRYGKLIKQFRPTEPGWDGTYQNSPLPTNDYWYSVVLSDRRVIKGHFTLKR
ncbi:T9SS type B sorting domain-containing protein [Tamlana sp. I1]|uniref:T9SS type B sorting domain-containing protein n=1 Tax=Tamlana sp. I1 TaxID=2762061 RepID=UPI00189000CE|nr:T9SS type B sorting domain-containing protein [Tamlana sp. I1]